MTSLSSKQLSGAPRPGFRGAIRVFLLGTVVGLVWNPSPTSFQLASPVWAQQAERAQARREVTKRRLEGMSAREARYRDRKRQEFPAWAQRRFPAPGVQRRLPRESDLPTVEELEAQAQE
jgi:hypothetical protein